MLSIFNKNLIFVILTICLLFIFLSPQIILATEETKKTEPEGKQIVGEGLEKTANMGGLLDTGQTDLPTMIGRVINYLFGIVGVIFLTVTIFGGVLWMVAGGSEEKVTKAKNLIRNGFLGIIIIFLAYALVYAILWALKQGVSGT